MNISNYHFFFLWKTATWIYTLAWTEPIGIKIKYQNNLSENLKRINGKLVMTFVFKKMFKAIALINYVNCILDLQLKVLYSINYDGWGVGKHVGSRMCGDYPSDYRRHWIMCQLNQWAILYVTIKPGTIVSGSIHSMSKRNVRKLLLYRCTFQPG